MKGSKSQHENSVHSKTSNFQQNPFFTKSQSSIQQKQEPPFFQSNHNINTIPHIQTKCTDCEKKKEDKLPVQTKSETGGTTASSHLSSKIESSSGRGKTLPKNTISEMNSSFGADFSDVRIHNDNEAKSLNKDLHAQAFTHGRDIYFNSGKYNPESSEGKHLLAHELTHVVQQNGESDNIQRKEADFIGESAIVIIPYGSDTSEQGNADKKKVQKLSNLLNTCWDNENVGISLHFLTAPFNTGLAPRTIPPVISVKLSYKEIGGFTTFQYGAFDAKPVWGGPGWLPDFQTFFSYPLNKEGILNIHIEMSDAEDDFTFLIYDDKIDFRKCGIQTSCKDNAFPTGRFTVLKDDGSLIPVDLHSGFYEEGETYEIYKEEKGEKYFICFEETQRIYVTKEGLALD